MGLEGRRVPVSQPLGQTQRNLKDMSWKASFLLVADIRPVYFPPYL